ncbi:MULTISPECIES: hypothetical protein [Burkholderia cepacia complex]|uniref:hypothetical protein n=1 Tax=Burkholderia cepacia complex TaxID=87882 RepID=UPI001050B151|nr:MULTISPECIES: hypothetical protein [Burkholderia cepacia complex]MBJ9920519.1 hypothetical protein [Burkholderia cenocepacia]MCA7941709.1 hypothetical protein [Burkholderia cepacia]
MATSWLLALMASGSISGAGAVAIADGGYKSEALCERTGSEAVARLERHEAEVAKANTTYSPGVTVQAYRARSWSYQCLPTDKG